MDVPREVTLLVNGRRAAAKLRRMLVALAPVLILVVALSLRLYGLDWDQRGLFHPDERAILMKVGELSLPSVGQLDLLFDADESPWNPRWFPYGSFPLYLLKGVQLAYAPVDELDIFNLRLPGRVISSLADTLTVMLVFALGTRLYGRRVGLLASALVALAVVHIQLSHFYAVDTLLTLFAVLSIYFMVRIAREGRLRDSALAGVFLGVGLATKVSLAPLLLPFFLAHAFYAFSRDGETLVVILPTRARLFRAVAGTVAGSALAVLVLFVTQPYAFIDWPRFLGDAIEQSEMVRRIRDYPYTRQYVDTTPYWYHIRQLATWGLGLPLGIVAWGGLVFATVFGLARRRKGDLLLLAWVSPYFLIIGAFDVKFMRYLLPVTPLLILMGSRMLFWIGDRIIDLSPSMRPWLAAGLVMLVGATALYALAYDTVYATTHPAVRASQWINQNVPKGTVIAQEHWEEGIPDLHDYAVPPSLVGEGDRLPMYEKDDSRKITLVSTALSEAEYLVLYSHRLYATIPRLPERYPVSSQYYRLLFSGQLGYGLVQSFTSYPNLLGVALVDDTFKRPGLPAPEGFESLGPSLVALRLGYADESFTVYDHPKTLIFRNAEHLSAQQLQGILEKAGDVGAQGQSRALGLMLSPQDARAQREGGTWSDIVRLDSWANRVPVVAWLILVEGMALLVLPLTFVVFRPLADRGFLFSKALGLLLVSYLVWLLASLQWMTFSPGSIMVALLAVGLPSLLILYKNWDEMASFVKQRWSILLIGEVLFLAAFFAFYILRLANPDLWHFYRGGEKPMDFAYLNGVLRSTYMPPYDPWFAGGYLNYYYLGQFMVATLIKGTGIEPAVAYNLAVPLFFALTVGVAFALVYNLAEGTRRSLGASRFSWSPVLAGVGAGLFVAVLGNLDGAVQVGQGAWRALVQNQPFGVFDFWRSSRLMPPGSEITEFPFFTFLFADLHAHLMAIPFTILVLSLGAALVLRNRGAGSREQGTRLAGRGAGLWEHGGQLLLLSLAVGSLRLINAWDFPIYMAIAAAAVLVGEYLGRGGLSLSMLLRGAVKVGIVYGLGFVLFLPFHQSYETFYTGLERTTNTTVLWQFLGINGLFVFIIMSFLLYEAWRRLPALVALLSGRGVASRQPEEGGTGNRTAASRMPLLLISGAAAVLLGLASWLYDYETVAFVGVLLALTVVLALGWLLSWGPESPYRTFVAIPLGAALALVIGVDIFRVEGDIERMNTVFKFYLQIWIMLALVSAYLLWRLSYGGTLLLLRPWAASRLAIRIGRSAWLAMLVLLLVSAFIYPVMGTQVRLRDRFQVLPMTVNGTAFMRDAVYGDPNGTLELTYDYDGIRWLQDNVVGSPVVLEGLTPLYRWGSRISIYTGLPSIVGWDWHQRQQRRGYDWAVTQRTADVDRIYATPDPAEALELMRKYDVKYVYLGQLERLYYPSQGIDKFRTMVGDTLDTVYEDPQEDPQVTIYRLRR